MDPLLVFPDPAPAELLQGPYSDARRLSEPALQAGFNFFANVPASDGRPLQDAYVAAVQQIVRHPRQSGFGKTLRCEPCGADANRCPVG